MSWDAWAGHVAVALAEQVRWCEVTPTEFAAQVAIGIARNNGALDAVIKLFDDVITDPLADGITREGVFASVPR